METVNITDLEYLRTKEESDNLKCSHAAMKRFIKKYVRVPSSKTGKPVQVNTLFPCKAYAYAVICKFNMQDQFKEYLKAEDKQVRQEKR